MLFHVAWFAAWMVVNARGVGPIRPFDPFPYPLLTMVVSLESIFLSLLVLASQNQLSRQADKRAHLDLQVDLLAEREMTTVLQLLQDIAVHLKVPETPPAAQIRDQAAATDLADLTRKVEEVEADEHTRERAG